MNMLTMKYEITAEQKQEIEEARKKNKDKRVFQQIFLQTG